MRANAYVTTVFSIFSARHSFFFSKEGHDKDNQKIPDVG
jgi:hypothetical protein